MSIRTVSKDAERFWRQQRKENAESRAAFDKATQSIERLLSDQFEVQQPRAHVIAQEVIFTLLRSGLDVSRRKTP